MKVSSESKNSVFVSVILPCFNEKENILHLIDAIHSAIHMWKHEIIVVDDNSPDGTYELVNNNPKEYIRSYKRLKDPSLAKSIRFGIEQAKGDYIVMMDSDFNHQPKEIPAMLANLEYFDCVSGSRFVYGGKMDRRFRHVASWIFNIFVRILTGKYVTDNLYGFIAIKRSKLFEVNFDDVFWGFGDYCIRLMYYLQCNGISILQVPSVLGKRLGGEGNSALIRTFVKYLKETIKLALKNTRKRSSVSSDFEV
ncbi:MAG: glycosyltransferase [Parachlamydiales bacterium]|nr:glycosyltransferase [Parachlamydiales bacterium]